MVQSGKERALRTKVHFNSIVLLDRFPPFKWTSHTTGLAQSGRLLAKAPGPFRLKVNNAEIARTCRYE